MTRLAIILIPLAALLACGDNEEEPLSERAGELATCVDYLVHDLSTHMTHVMNADRMIAVDMIEERHLALVNKDLDDLDYWLGRVNECELEGSPLRTPKLDRLAVYARREASLHRLKSALATTVEEARDEENRHQVAMMQYFGEMRPEHTALEISADQIMCASAK